MKQTRILKGLCLAAVTMTLLLTFGASSWGHTPLDHEPVGAPAADQVARAQGRPAQPAACRDTTPHEMTFVEVEPGVRLEVLDWGGSGEAMVLLTGGGDNAHVYDQFAFQFTDYFHVIGITRRGYPPSSQPQNGYDVETRAADDIAVLDAFGIDKAVFVGHSAAGAELSELGQAYKERVNKLVYLDAADLAERFLPSRSEPPLPVYTDADLKSLWAFQAASARLQALRQPDPSVCLRVKFDTNGAIVDSTTPDWIADKIAEGVAATPPTNWANIEAPRLGIFALFTIEARQPWYWYLTADEQAAFDEAWAPIVAWHEETIGKFAEGNSANTFLLPGAPHYVYIYNEAEVVRRMRQFLGLPVGGE
jgi:non-heme chloroperoxidase